MPKADRDSQGIGENVSRSEAELIFGPQHGILKGRALRGVQGTTLDEPAQTVEKLGQ